MVEKECKSLSKQLWKELKKSECKLVKKIVIVIVYIEIYCREIESEILYHEFNVIDFCCCTDDFTFV